MSLSICILFRLHRSCRTGLTELQWFLVSYRIDYKMLLLVYETRIHGQGLATFLIICHFTLSSTPKLLHIQYSSKRKTGDAVFHPSAWKVWFIVVTPPGGISLTSSLFVSALKVYLWRTYLYWRLQRPISGTFKKYRRDISSSFSSNASCSFFTYCCENTQLGSL